MRLRVQYKRYIMETYSKISFNDKNLVLFIIDWEIFIVKVFLLA